MGGAPVPGPRFLPVSDPMSFSGGTPVSGPRHIPYFWSHVLSGGGGGYPSPVTGPTWGGGGIPSWDWVTPPPTGYAVGGMPLAVSRRRAFFLVQHFCGSLS